MYSFMSQVPRQRISQIDRKIEELSGNEQKLLKNYAKLKKENKLLYNQSRCLHNNLTGLAETILLKERERSAQEKLSNDFKEEIEKLNLAFDHESSLEVKEEIKSLINAYKERQKKVNESKNNSTNLVGELTFWKGQFSEQYIQTLSQSLLKKEKREAIAAEINKMIKKAAVLTKKKKSLLKYSSLRINIPNRQCHI